MTGVDETTLEFEVLTSRSELEAFRDTWEALFAASDAAPCLGYDWIHATLIHQSTGAGIYFCVARDDAGPLAVLPLMARRGLFATRLELFGGGPANCNGAILTERALKFPLLSSACEWLGKFHLDWDYCVLEKIPSGSPLLETEVEMQPGRRSGATDRVPIGASQIIELPDSMDAYKKSIAGKHRLNVVRTVRNLRRRHDVRQVRLGLDPSGDASSLGTLMEDALAVSRKSWQASADLGHAISDPDQTDFFREASRALARRGMLDLAVLYADQRPIAYSWGATRNAFVSLHAIGFDLEMKSAGPGLVHQALLIEDSIERGLSAIELGHESAHHKRRWASAEVELFDVWHYARPRSGRVRQRLQRRWDRSVLSRARRRRPHGDPAQR
jgi:CelD/BcsL family acetyltransferase involved in cellulose biosynthesis